MRFLNIIQHRVEFTQIYRIQNFYLLPLKSLITIHRTCFIYLFSLLILFWSIFSTNNIFCRHFNINVSWINIIFKFTILTRIIIKNFDWNVVEFLFGIFLSDININGKRARNNWWLIFLTFYSDVWTKNKSKLFQIF